VFLRQIGRLLLLVGSINGSSCSRFGWIVSMSASRNLPKKVLYCRSSLLWPKSKSATSTLNLQRMFISCFNWTNLVIVLPSPILYEESNAKHNYDHGKYDEGNRHHNYGELWLLFNCWKKMLICKLHWKDIQTCRSKCENYLHKYWWWLDAQFLPHHCWLW
jgi:hypothetical protein